jgi:hypothetical protein
MKQFNPPIAERNTNELIIIALDERGEWHPDAMDQAKAELKRRRISYEEKISVSTQYNDQRVKLEADFIEQKKNESLSAWEIVHSLHNILLFPWIYFTYRSFKADGYEQKAEQMLLFLKISGVLILLIAGIVMMN